MTAVFEVRSTRLEGTYRGYPILKALPLSGSRCLLLLDTYERLPPPYGNLVCVQGNGEMVWAAEEHTHEPYVEFKMEGDELLAHTWGGFLLKLDPASGKTLETTFVK